MKRTALLFIITLGFFFSGCATDQAMRKATSDPPTKQHRVESREDLQQRLTLLEKTVSSLRSEVEELQWRLKNTTVRRPLSEYRLPDLVTLCGERIPIENRKVRENLEQEFLLLLGNEARLILWIKRAQRYFPHIEKRLRELSLPDDLKYVTIVESSLYPYALSSSGAAGIWQFIPSTGERYGMRNSGGIDERYDFIKATEGALNYLKSLYEEFRSWILAMAAYNCGENRLRKEIQFQRTNNYFFLDLPMETERYVYKIAVAKIILSNPKTYGLNVRTEDLYDPLLLDRVYVELHSPLPLIEVSAGIGVHYKELRELNPHILGENLPPGGNYLNLPYGSAGAFWAFFNQWKNEGNCSRCR